MNSQWELFYITKEHQSQYWNAFALKTKRHHMFVFEYQVIMSTQHTFLFWKQETKTENICRFEKQKLKMSDRIRNFIVILLRATLMPIDDRIKRRGRKRRASLGKKGDYTLFARLNILVYMFAITTKWNVFVHKRFHYTDTVHCIHNTIRNPNDKLNVKWIGKHKVISNNS